jgi:hypothetical protein
MTSLPTETASLRKGLATTSLVVGLLSLPTLAGLIIGGVAGLVLGIVALLRANKQPSVYGGKGVAIAGIIASALSFVTLPILAIAAAIVIPLMRTANTGNEVAAISTLRAVSSAEASYAAASGGGYGSLECLASPASCLPAGAGETKFIDQALVGNRFGGYLFTFHPGPSTSADPASPAGASLRSFAYTAVPADGTRGMRAFCIDSTGRLKFTRGTPSAIIRGGCEGGGWLDYDSEGADRR